MFSVMVRIEEMIVLIVGKSWSLYCCIVSNVLLMLRKL